MTNPWEAQTWHLANHTDPQDGVCFCCCIFCDPDCNPESPNPFWVPSVKVWLTPTADDPPLAPSPAADPPP